MHTEQVMMLECVWKFLRIVCLFLAVNFKKINVLIITVFLTVMINHGELLPGS